jgi:hypothetical protein
MGRALAKSRGLKKKQQVGKKVVDGRKWLGYSAESVATKSSILGL